MIPQASLTSQTGNRPACRRWHVLGLAYAADQRSERAYDDKSRRM